jgi:hypothetical protein
VVKRRIDGKAENWTGFNKYREPRRMTTDSAMFADIKTSSTSVGSGTITAIRMTTIAIGMAICDFMVRPVVQQPYHPARIAY